LLAAKILGQIHRDTLQPGREIPLRFLGGGVPVDAVEDLLSQVFGFVSLVNEGAQKGTDLPPVTLHQPGEGGVISPRDGLHQFVVAGVPLRHGNSLSP